VGPHPCVADVRRAVRTALDGLPAADRDRPVLVACSGGADSTALAAATAFHAQRIGRRAGAVTVDHGLQEGSAAQADRTATLLRELGLTPVHVVRVDVARGGGPEAAARTARYAALERVAGAAPPADPPPPAGARGAGGQAVDGSWLAPQASLGALILLGHTRDDQAETVLLGLGRGSGPRSIAGMPRYEGRYLRPLLAIERRTTVQACAELGLPVWDDPHNLDPAFRRVRLRHEVLPLLDDVLGGGVPAALARTAELLREDLDALDAVAAGVAQLVIEADGSIITTRLAAQPRAIRTRILRSWVAQAGADALNFVHLRALDAVVSDWHGQGLVDLPGGFTAIRRSGRLHIQAP
jgi:tRNA(Ile)-lysidine synthase